MDKAIIKRVWADLEALQAHYKSYHDFAHDVFTDLLGFNYTRIQRDIGDYLCDGPLYRMIQAQRGEAKTTLTAIYVVWRLIHNPRIRALIVSAGGSMARQVSNWVIQIIMRMPELECLRPNTQQGDRSSVEAFDINYILKGAEKSPSVACLGITANIQGYRADLLVADDIESSKNSATAAQREILLDRTKEFSNICSTGDIIYLGTPQNTDSVYNTLPSRGFDIRIWTGRYPSAEELPNYKNHLAPLLLEDISKDPTLQTGGGLTGTRGKPTDPELLNEDALVKKELDQGRSHFQLQHMLDTTLLDGDRYPLKLSDTIFMPVPQNRGPLGINWMRDNNHRIFQPMGFPLQDSMYKASSFDEEFAPFEQTVMYVDPSGGGKNGDELAWAVIKFLAGKLFLADVGGMPGGYSEDKLAILERCITKHKPSVLLIEKNFGNGAFKHMWTPRLLKLCGEIGHMMAIEEVWETGQKELRIIDTLEPINSSGRFIIDQDLVQRDWDSVQKYPVEVRTTYSFFFQFARITRTKGSLSHDDRLDAVAGAARYFTPRLLKDSEKALNKVREENYRRLVSDPLGTGRSIFGDKKEPSALDKFKRKF